MATARTIARRPGSLAQVVLTALLLGLALVGWLVTNDRMQGMDAGPGTDLGALGFYVTAWVVMMAAMMFPSIAPMVLGYARISPRLNRGRGARATTATFVGGYLISWTAFGLAAYATFAGVRALAGDELGWHRAGPYVAGAIIVAAAIYQLTPAKDACLRRCRAPFDFLTDEWRPGQRGALIMGVRHGAWCVGCCWALMAALFALGVMSVGWMIFVSVLIAIEKLTPWPRQANLAIAVVLLALGIGVATVPSHVPGLTEPGSAMARQAMRSMKSMQPAQPMQPAGKMR